MPPSGIERTRTGATQGIAAVLATISGAVLLLLTIAGALLLVADVFGRYAFQRPLLSDTDVFDAVTTYLGLGFAGAALLALPAALAAPFVHSSDHPVRSHSALALVPGALAAVAVVFAAIAAMAVLRDIGIVGGATLAWKQSLSFFSALLFLFLAITVVLAAAFSGARTPEATAAAAAPVVMAGFLGMVAEISITELLLALVLPLLVAAAILAILYAFAPARTITPWLAGIALALGVASFVATGLFTPTEAVGFIALFGLLIAIPVRTLALGQPLRAILRQAATESVAVVAIVVATLTAVMGVAQTIASSGIADALGGWPAMLAIGAAAFLILAYFLTPLLVIGLGLPSALPLLKAAGIDTTLAGAMTILLGLAAVAARAARRDPAAPSLPPAVAWIVAAVFVALAAVAAFAPKLVLAPVQLLR